MLPFAMRSAPILVRFVGITPSCVVWLSSRTFAPAHVSDRFVNPLFSYSYKSLFPQAFWNHIYTKRPGVWGHSHSTVLANDRSGIASRLLSHCYRLFCTPKKANSFAIKRIQTLLRKYRGWGYLADVKSLTHGRFGPRQPSATWTPLAHPTIIAVTSRFQVHG
jgi:hypothetical protein